MKWTGQGIHTRKEMDNLVSTQGGGLCGVGASMDPWNPTANSQGNTRLHPSSTMEKSG